MRAQQDVCGVGEFPARFYCPQATTERVVVSDGYYSTPESASEEHREDQSVCPQQYDCVNGTRRVHSRVSPRAANPEENCR